MYIVKQCRIRFLRGMQPSALDDGETKLLCACCATARRVVQTWHASHNDMKRDKQASLEKTAKLRT